MAALSLGGWIQVPGFAEITRPQSGAPLTGIVTIEGTADHPDFESYDLDFAYDPNPTNTWFPITTDIEASVQDGRLALWDTAQISSGTYQIRLTVNATTGPPLTEIVAGLGIGVAEPDAPEPDDSIMAEPRLEPAGETVADAMPEGEAPDQPLAPEALVRRVVLSGALAAAAILLAWGAYSTLRPPLRRHIGYLQSRRFHARQRRPPPPP